MHHVDHCTAILRKLGLYRRTQAAVLAQCLLVADAGPIWPGDAAPAGFGEDDTE